VEIALKCCWASLGAMIAAPDILIPL